jgi:hypothetical protein
MSTDMDQSSGTIKRLDVLTAKRISQEIKEGIDAVRSKFLSKRKDNARLQYKNVSAMVSMNKEVNDENVNTPMIARAQ